MEPRTETVGVTQAAQVAPCDDESFLDGVLGEIAVVQHQLGDAVEARDPGSGEARERVAVAVLRKFHEISVHPRPLVQHAPLSPS
jgi:hypothetical protein